MKIAAGSSFHFQEFAWVGEEVFLPLFRNPSVCVTQKIVFEPLQQQCTAKFVVVFQ